MDILSEIDVFKKKWKVSTEYSSNLARTKKYVLCTIREDEDSIFPKIRVIHGIVEKNKIEFKYSVKKFPFLNSDFINEFEEILKQVQKEM